MLAEGVNLQQARHVINYDLPWNPQRLTQRHGRIDRLLSPHPEVFIRCFFPEQDSDLDRLLMLENRLRKMNQAVKIFGGTNVITGEQLDIAYAHQKKSSNSWRRTRTCFDPEETGRWAARVPSAATSGDGKPGQLDRVRELPWGRVRGSIATAERRAGSFVPGSCPHQPFFGSFPLTPTPSPLLRPLRPLTVRIRSLPGFGDCVPHAGPTFPNRYRTNGP